MPVLSLFNSATNILDAVFSMFFAPCTVIQLCNVNQQNVLFELMFKSNSTCHLHVSTILYSSSGRTYCICSFIPYVLSCIYARSLAGWRVCSILYPAHPPPSAQNDRKAHSTRNSQLSLKLFMRSALSFEFSKF